MKKQTLIRTFLLAAMLLGAVGSYTFAQDGGLVGSGGGRTGYFGSGLRDGQIVGPGARSVVGSGGRSGYIGSGNLTEDDGIMGSGSFAPGGFHGSGTLQSDGLMGSGSFTDGGMIGSGTVTGGMLGSGTATSGGGGTIGSGTLREDDGGGTIGSGTRSTQIFGSGARTSEESSFLSAILRFFGF